MSAEQDFEHPPPPGPPPALSAEQITHLCRQGWLNYDIPTHLSDEIDQLQAEAAAFFRQDVETKTAAVGSKDHEEEGYYLVPGEKEYVTFRRSLSEKLELQDRVSSIWSQVARILYRMLCDLSRAGNLTTTAWDQVVKGALNLPAGSIDLGESPTLMRLFRYDASSGVAEKHTDLGLLTMCVGTGAGLEVVDRSDGAAAWIGSSKCTVLIGECLRRLSGNNIRAGVHRVVANPVGRQSLVFALRPNLTTTVDLKDFGGEGSINLKEMFLNIKGSKYNINARHEIREQQKGEKANEVHAAQG